MNAAAETQSARRGADLLLEHCAALSRFEHVRPSPSDRLEQALGGDLTRLLLAALAGDHRMPSRGLPD